MLTWSLKDWSCCWRTPTGGRSQPSVTAHTKGSGLSTGKANEHAMLKEKRATTLTQFLVTRLVIQGGEEADGTLVSQDVKKTHEFTVETARCRQNQREEGLVRVMEVIRTVFIALRFRHSRVNEHLVGIGVAKLTVTRRVDDVAMKIMNKCDVDDEVRRPGHIQALNLQIPASLAAAGRNTAAAVGAKARVVCDVSDSREEELVSTLPIA